MFTGRFRVARARARMGAGIVAENRRL